MQGILSQSVLQNSEYRENSADPLSPMKRKIFSSEDYLANLNRKMGDL